ncbi:NADH:flavin oxidoreductase/NADH oxidase family protein [Urechidicola sp. KH5]
MTVKSNSPLATPFKLPCGVVLKNRIVKAAMTERLADKNNHSTQALCRLYEHWSSTGSAVLLSGNIMVDGRYKESGGNVVIEDESGLDQLKQWTNSATKHGNQFWAQLSHAGRQATIFSTFKPIAPSAVQLKKLGLFAKPKAMTIAQIEDVIERYVNTAVICKKAGFTGVQFHGAHGYLLSQFLSLRTNWREDEYGGSIENRSKVLVTIIKKARVALGVDFPISVKLNSADFQRGGFEENDAFYVIEQLEKLGVDLLEISGGTYENIAFFEKANLRESTRKREAFFMDFADKLRNRSNIPLMVTGGFRTKSFCEDVIANKELDMIGFGRPYLADASFPKSFISGNRTQIEDPAFSVKSKHLKDMAEGGFYDYQIYRLSQGKELKPNYSPWSAILRLIYNEFRKGWL